MSNAFTLDGKININADEVVEGLKRVDRQVDNTDDGFKKNGKDIESSLISIKTVGLQALNDLGDKMASGLGSLISNATEGTLEFRNDMSKLKTVAGETSNTWGDVNEQFKQFNAISGESDSSVEALNNLMNTGLNGKQLANAVDLLSGAVVRFPDTMKIESLADSLQETVATGAATGQFSELLGRLGINVDEFNDKLEACPSKTDRISLAMQTLCDTGLANTNREWERANKDLIDNSNAQISYQEALSNLGTTLTPLITSLTNFASKLINWFNSLSPAMQKVVGVVAVIVALLPTIVSLISGIITIGSALMGGISLAVAGPIALVIAGIAAVIAIGVLLYKNWDTIKEKCSQLWVWVKAKFNAFKDWLGNIFVTDWRNKFGIIGNVVNGLLSTISGIFNSIKRIFGGIIDFVAGVFTGDWSRTWEGVVNIFGGIMGYLESIVKAPLNGVIWLINRAIDGLNSISVKVPRWVPGVGGKRFGFDLPYIDYLENGGILTQPTMLTSNVMAGEKNQGKQGQAEAVIPLTKLYKMIEDIANRPIEVQVNGKALVTACGTDISQYLGNTGRRIR